MALTEEFLPDLLTIKVATGAATISKIHRIKKDGVMVSEQFTANAAVEAIGPWSLAGVLTTLQASTLAGKSAAEAQVATLTAEKEALQAALAALQAKYDTIKPPATVKAKHVRIALDKLALAKAWGAAVEATVAALDAAKDPNPKRVYAWWYEADQIDPLGAEWGLITGEMDKAKGWGASSALALLALVAELGADAAKSSNSGKPNGQ